jgi:hypothetical protein
MVTIRSVYDRATAPVADPVADRDLRGPQTDSTSCEERLDEVGAPQRPTQLPGEPADNHAGTRARSDDFYAALWIGALLFAGGAAIDAFSDDLDELAQEFFERFRPMAKA